MLRGLVVPGGRRWPAPLAFSRPIGPVPGQPVPNRSSINWPEAQFAPRFLPPGSPSYSPYRYPDGPIVDYPLRYELPPALEGTVSAEPRMFNGFQVSPQSFGAPYGVEAKSNGADWKGLGALGAVAAVAVVTKLMGYW